MLQSEIKDVIFIRIRDNAPLGLTGNSATELAANRIFTATTNPAEDSVTRPYVVIYHEPVSSEITTYGSPETCRRFDRGGIIRIKTHVPLGVGADTLAEIIAEQIQALFEGRPYDAPLHYDAVELRESRRDKASWTCDVVITYRLDVVK